MSVQSSDIVVYGAANIAEDNSSAQGGAIDTSVRYVFDDSTLANTLNDTVDVVSNASGDTSQTVTVYGRDASGSIVSEAFSLNGTNEQLGATTFERILKIVVDAVHTGTITVRDNGTDTTIADIESGVLEIRRPFYDVAADVSGGSSRDFYEKVFVKNNNGTNALLSAEVKENADPSGNITFDLEDAQDDNNSTASRLNTAPAGMNGSFDNDDKSVPGTDLAAGSAIGVWLKLTLAAGASASKSTWTMQVTGNTT